MWGIAYIEGSNYTQSGVWTERFDTPKNAKEFLRTIKPSSEGGRPGSLEVWRYCVARFKDGEMIPWSEESATLEDRVTILERELVELRKIVEEI